MTHEQAAPLLLAFLEKASDGMSDDLRAHVATCRECGSLASTYRALRNSAAARRRRAGPDHPASESIVDFALAPHRLAPEEKDRLHAHLELCPDCSDDLASVYLAEKEARAPAVVAFRSSRRPLVWATAASVALALVLGYPAYLGLHDLPRARREGSTLRSERDLARREARDLRADADRAGERANEVAEWSGIVDLPFLASPLRGAEDETRLRVGPAQPFVPLAVDLGSVGTLLQDREHIFEVEAEGGRVVWRFTMTGAELRRRANDDGFVAFLVPAPALPAGPYRLVLRPADAPPSRFILRNRFRVEADYLQSPAATKPPQ